MNKKIIEIPYGDGMLSLAVGEQNLLGVILPGGAAPERLDEQALLHAALEQPIGTPPLRRLAKPGQKIAIITSDMTRPCPSERLLPPILDELRAAGVHDDDVFIVIGLGLHRPMTPAEIEKVVGAEAARCVRVINHDAEDVVHLGTTSRGTPIEVFRPVVEADFRICLANLEFHWFAGYSGGAKAILPGIASKACVTANHSLMIQPGVGSGRIEGNPLRMDIEEGAALLGVDFIFNVVVDGEHRIIGAVAGDVTAAHRAGCRMIAERGMVQLDRKADIVIASAGGFPKDINMYQAHKGLENASYFVRDGGALILAAECREGWGNKTFESWMLAAKSPEDVLLRIRQDFQLGGHKAAGIAKIVSRVKVHLASGLPGEQAEKMFMTPQRDLQSALEAALADLGPESTVLVLPLAGSIIPAVS